MKNYIVADEWKIIEDGFHEEFNEVSESLFSIGNGHMGQRANFEEGYSGKTLQGSYVGGVYYPDKTKVGWWKNGYPEYFAKVLNSVNWIGLSIHINGELLDLAKVKKISHFNRELDMMNGILKRSFQCTLNNGNEIKVSCRRFVSMETTELAVMSYMIEAINFDANIEITSFLDANVMNKDSNYDEKFWVEMSQHANEDEMGVVTKTRKTDFIVSALAHTRIENNGKYITNCTSTGIQEKYASQTFRFDLKRGFSATVEKYVIIASSLNHIENDLIADSRSLLNSAVFKGVERCENEHSLRWHKIWMDCDIEIHGDISAQQGIRYNIFQLYATYTGQDARLNIGPKGFTGEKYGGSTYWDTEAYCLPFYMATADVEIAKNLLVYRYNQLDKAIENAQKLGFKNGAALYPMVTMNGEECHNEWEITFEEIHRNGAIAYGIYDYVNYTGDRSYLEEKGIEVLIGIARFWAQRINFSEDKGQYVMLGVTGPNEYENNVNNNWYTNYIAVWCLKYAKSEIENLVSTQQHHWNQLSNKLNFNVLELTQWQEIISNMYFPVDDKKGIFLQQDGYLDKEQITVDFLPETERPINQKWSWDRILRSCFIKQADVLQGLYFFEDDFDMTTHINNYKFYEARTVHESSLSPCVHSILAAKIGDRAKSYEMYLRTSRLDLDDYNNDTEDGLHITSMAGTWLSVVKGFGGLRVKNGHLHLNPFLPSHFTTLSFKVKFRGSQVACSIGPETISINNENTVPLEVFVGGKSVIIGEKSTVNVAYKG